MGDKTGIEWADATWNPIIGCRRVSAGCENCYAELAALKQIKQQAGHKRVSPYTEVVKVGADGKYLPQWNGKAKVMHDRIDQPIRWRKRRRIFVNSMSDIAHPDVSMGVIAQIWAAMLITSLHADRGGHTYIVLTKRIERLRDVLTHHAFARTVANCAGEMMDDGDGWHDSMWKHLCAHGPVHPLIRVGVSVEDQATADERIPLLLQTPAAVRIVSLEPMLGPVDIGMGSATCDCCDRIWSSRWLQLPRKVRGDFPGHNAAAEPGIYRATSNKHGALCVTDSGGSLLGVRPSEATALPRLDQVIVGGESGRKARSCNESWVRSIVNQCAAAGVPCFVKQLGANARSPAGHPLVYAHPKGGDMDEWSVDLRVRQDVGQ